MSVPVTPGAEAPAAFGQLTSALAGRRRDRDRACHHTHEPGQQLRGQPTTERAA